MAEQQEINYDLVLVAKRNQEWEFKYPQSEYETDHFSYVCCTDGSIHKIMIKGLPHDILTDKIARELMEGQFYEEECILLDKIKIKLDSKIYYALLLWPNDNTIPRLENSRALQLVQRYSSYPSPIDNLYGDCIITFHCVE